MVKNHIPLCVLFSFCTTEYLMNICNNKRNAWVADNLVPLNMPFLSTGIIA